MELAKETAALLVDGKKRLGFLQPFFRWREQNPEELIPEEAAKPSDGNLHYHIGRGFAI